MKHVLSISLGSSARDSCAELELLGQRLLLERRGTDGSLERFERMLLANDGVVDCLTIGGTNLGLYCAGRYYPFREISTIAGRVTKTPVVDGSGLKDTLERRTLHWLQDAGLVDFTTAKVLVTCGIDRFGVAETLDEMGANVHFGDTMFILGMPWALPSLRALQMLGLSLLPIVTRLPFRWVYPTGGKQDEIAPKYGRHYRWADVIAGDFHYIRRHMPDDLTGKVILTNTLTTEDVTALRDRGVALLVTSTPAVGQRTFATNVIQGAFVCALGRRPEEISAEDYARVADEIGWEPTVRDLTKSAAKERPE
ncbi:MAG: quinate 5-dehydrogenase [Armatimonadia bacterium]|nr:quinate 5-dehydrogenase [Armatimonadia bacterium]